MKGRATENNLNCSISNPSNNRHHLSIEIHVPSHRCKGPGR
jgi:hypothetical protein